MMTILSGLYEFHILRGRSGRVLPLSKEPEYNNEKAVIANPNPLKAVYLERNFGPSSSRVLQSVGGLPTEKFTHFK
jgi:hypothetical protein